MIERLELFILGGKSEVLQKKKRKKKFDIISSKEI